MKAYNFKKSKLQRYYNNGMTLRDIAKELNCSQDTVYDYFVKYDIPRRKKSRTANLLMLKEKAIFERKVNPYWIVGLIDGEGSFVFRNEHQQKRMYPILTIAQKNKETLLKIKSCFPSLNWTLRKSKGGTHHLSIKSFERCVQLFWFFDKCKPIEKDSQYHIWKFMITELIQNDFSWNLKIKIWHIYKTEKVYNEFIKKYNTLLNGERICY